MNNQFPAYGFGAPRPQARNTQPLTEEQINKLRNNSQDFDMSVSQEDLWKAICTHKDKNGNSTLVEEPDGHFRCNICHERFKFCDSTDDEIQKAVDTITDMLQTTKTIYVDAPNNLAKEYYQILALLKKFPSLWKRAVQNFSIYDNGGMNALNQMGPGYSGFAAMNTLLTNPYGGYGYNQQYGAYQQPVYNPYLQQQPMMAGGYNPYAQQQQMVQPQMAQVDPSGNPMAYGAPAMAVPQAPVPGVMPQAAPAAAPATAPAQQTDVQQQQVFNV